MTLVPSSFGGVSGEAHSTPGTRLLGPHRPGFTHLFIPVQPIPLNRLHLFMRASSISYSMESQPPWLGLGWYTEALNTWRWLQGAEAKAMVA